MKSLRMRLALWVLAGTALALLGAGIGSYYIAREQVNGLFDAQMEALVTRLLVAPQQLRPLFSGPTIRDESDDEGHSPGPNPHGFQIQVGDAAGLLRLGNVGFPLLPRDGFWNVRVGKTGYRVYQARQGGLVAQVAQRAQDRVWLSANYAFEGVLPYFFLAPALAFMVWWGVGRGLRPMRRLAGDVARRGEDDLAALPGDELPLEMRPLVAALNRLMARLDQALQRQRHFIADAAHELRTPLAALALQVEVAAAERDPAARAALLEELRGGITRAGRLVTQLLDLARLGPESAVQFEELELSEFVRQTVADYFPLAECQGIDLGVAGLERILIEAEPVSLRLLLGNLLDNALKYTTRGGRVDVSVLVEPVPRLRVADTGAGIPPEEREHMFERFRRGEAVTEAGSGLGLAIVAEAALRNRARVSLLDSAAGMGLCVEVAFPPAVESRDAMGRAP